MSLPAVSLAIVLYFAWEFGLFAAAMRIAEWVGWRDSEPAERWLAVLAIDVTLESSVAAIFSFARINSPAVYWLAAAICLAVGVPALRRARIAAGRSGFPHRAAIAALAAPLVLLSFKPVEEIDSINYLHYLIDWMGNRATPYTFATNYVAFWELSFLPAWMVTRVDFFFPLLAAKAVVLLALALWLAGRELGLSGPLLLWTVAGGVTMRHFWFEYSGVPTLKNDALHGVGFVLLALVAMRAARRALGTTDWALAAFGAAFASVKYTGIFVAALAIVIVVPLRRPPWRAVLAVAAFFLLTSGHYYLHNFLAYGSPFYPFQINLGPIHLPGTADLSNTSILYSLHDPRLWRALFLPAGGISPAGLLFPAILAAALVAGSVICVRAAWSWLRQSTHPTPLEWGAFLILCGWLLYFRSVFSASAWAGDLAFILNNLNSIRYVDGVLALSEVLLVALLARFPWTTWRWVAWTLVVLNLASRLIALYARIPADLFPLTAVCAAASAAAILFVALKRPAIAASVVILLVGAPLLVERNRSKWTTYWNDLKPSLASVRGPQLAELALPDGGYFAGHVVAAGNPVDPAVRTWLPEEVDALSPAQRPRYLAVLLTSGSEAASDWRARYASKLTGWGYSPVAESAYGVLLKRQF